MRTFQTAFRASHSTRNASTLVHKHDNMLYVRKIGRTAAAFFPFYAVVLGWPVSFYSPVPSLYSVSVIVGRTP